jgi:hypothetical protein
MTSNRTILITGVTGNQGGAVAQALQGAGFYLRGLTRKPGSERAAALARHGVEIVKGDLDDEATLRRVSLRRVTFFMRQRTALGNKNDESMRSEEVVDAGQLCPNSERACREAVWLEQRLLLGDREDMDDIVEAISKLYERRQDLQELPQLPELHSERIE